MNNTESRHLNWDSTYNTRDLGGLPAGGGVTRRGAIIRSDLLSRLSAAGRQALLDYGVRTIIDLRGPAEVAQEPSAHFAVDAPAPTYLNLPLEAYDPAVGAQIKQAETRAEVYCLVLDHYPANMAAVMRAIATAPAGGVAIHCHAGKDRTGIVAALLLRLAGVDPDLIAADYAESQARLWPLYEQLVAEAGGEDKVGFWLKPTVVPAMMIETLDHVDRQYGGVAAYLAQAGLTADEIDQLRRRIVDA